MEFEPTLRSLGQIHYARRWRQEIKHHIKIFDAEILKTETSDIKKIQRT